MTINEAKLEIENLSLLYNIKMSDGFYFKDEDQLVNFIGDFIISYLGLDDEDDFWNDLDSDYSNSDQFNIWLQKQVDRQDLVGKFAVAALADPKTHHFGTLIGYWVTWALTVDLENGAYRAISEFEGMSAESAAERFPV